MLSLGLMSGTSADGIDAALIETDGKSQIVGLANTSLSYHPDFRILLKSAELAVREAEGDIAIAKQNLTQAITTYLSIELGIPTAAIAEKIKKLSTYFHGDQNTPVTFEQIVRRSTELHIEVVHKLLSKSGYPAAKVDLIGYHGQTLFHRPAKISLQVGDGKLLAEETGITVINNFRSKDVAAGGQGAPLVPIFHQALAIRDNNIPAVIVNCGGIANITLVTGKHESDLIGFDTGPGNGLVDRYIRLKTSGQEQMDEDGKYGLNGKVSDDILKLLYEKSILINQKNYFDQAPPKSLDAGDLQLIPELDALSLEDACATLEAFTADTIVNSMKYFKSKIPQCWILAGGGWKNPVIYRELKERLKNKVHQSVVVMTAEQAGWDSTALEAETFAYLAVRSLQNLPISLPGTTRVPEPLSGGDIHLSSYHQPTAAVAEWLAAFAE